MTTDTVLVSIHSRNNRDLAATEGQLNRINWDAKDRTKNALKILFTLLGAAFACIFVPILHFILVPALFISAFVMAIDKFQETHRNAGGVGVCPKYHQTFEIVKSKWQERLTDTCGNCHDDLEILIPQT